MPFRLHNDIYRSQGQFKHSQHGKQEKTQPFSAPVSSLFMSIIRLFVSGLATHFLGLLCGKNKFLFLGLLSYGQDDG